MRKSAAKYPKGIKVQRLNGSGLNKLKIQSSPFKYPEKDGISISRNGDLINQVFLEVELPALLTSYLDDPTGGTGD